MGLGEGLTTPPCKTHPVTETAPNDTRTDQMDNDPTHRQGQLKWKNVQNIGSWNVRSLNRVGAEFELENQS